MIYVGIDVAKDKHDCFITNSDGEVLFKPFTITNNLDGFNELYQKIESVTEDATKVKVGLEATGHYSYNLLGYLIDKGLAAYVINPLHTNLYRKSLSLRQTKTDKVDARTIASMLMSDVNLKSYLQRSFEYIQLYNQSVPVGSILSEAKIQMTCRVVHPRSSQSSKLHSINAVSEK